MQGIRSILKPSIQLACCQTVGTGPCLVGRVPAQVILSPTVTSQRRHKFTNDFKPSSQTETRQYGGSVIEAVKHDHEELRDYYNKIKNVKDDETKVRYQNQFPWELA
jgi:hypothetical protein